MSFNDIMVMIVSENINKKTLLSSWEGLGNQDYKCF